MNNMDEIRVATHDDIPMLRGLAEEFASSTEFVKCFDFDSFSKAWHCFIDSAGVIFILGDFDGMLGAIKYPDINNGQLTSMECFWYVSPSKRGKGKALLTAFETWSKENGCSTMRMVHLTDSMPERLQTVYKRMGYKAVEVHYVKEL